MPSVFFSILSPTEVQQAAQRYSYLSPSGKTKKQAFPNRHGLTASRTVKFSGFELVVLGRGFLPSHRGPEDRINFSLVHGQCPSS